jgi:chlorobactene lauroyltransferase
MVEPGLLPEIPANHKPFAQEIIYRAFVLPSLTGQFQRVRLAMHGQVPSPQQGPLIVYLTHTSWWDAYMLFLISYHLLANGFQNYIMMEAKQLRVYRFFAWCGAFSIDRTIPGDAERSIRYIVDQLQARPGRCLWIFPQGRIAPVGRALPHCCQLHCATNFAEPKSRKRLSIAAHAIRLSRMLLI